MIEGPETSAPAGVIEAFRRVASASPERAAVVEHNRSVSYAELEERSRRIAAGLASQGVRARNRVVLALGRGADLIAATLAVVRLGAAYVPVDPAWPAARLRSIFGQTSPAAIIAGSANDALPGARTPADLETAGEPHAGVFADHRAGPDDPIYAMFTSGTTGEPKGVVVPHRAVWRLVEHPDFMETGPDRVWLQLAATSFDAATLEIWTPLVRGGSLAPVGDEIPSLDDIARVIERAGVTDAWLTASLFNALVDFRIDAFSSMKQVLTGGERLSPDHVARFIETHPAIRLINGYGPTENTTFTCCHTIDVADVRRPGGIPIGRAIRGTTVRVVDDELRDVADGEPGELIAGGAGVSLGYLGDDALTAERFVGLPGRDGPWYRTGDLVKRANPTAPIEFLGRRDRQVKIRGHRIELEEVERVLRELEGVGQAFAFAIGTRADERRLVGAVALADGTPALEPGSLRAAALAAAPEYIVPDRIVVLDEVPIGPTGKVDREAIGRLLEPGVPEPATPNGRPAPGWALLEPLLLEVLEGLTPTPDDGFLALGGHSIAALRLAAAIEREHGVGIGVAEILRTGRLGDLAQRIELEKQPHITSESRPAPPADPAPEGSTPPASSIQRQLFFENAVDPTGIAYHEHVGFFVPGDTLEPERAIAAFRRLVRRHEALRTNLVLEDAGLLQVIEPPAAADDAVARLHEPVNWTTTPDGAPDPSELHPAVRGAIAVPFELERDLPARLDIFPIEQGGHAVVLSFQHAAVDEWSLGIIESEFAALYADPDALTEPAPPYSLYSAREESESDESQIATLVDRLMTVGEPRAELARAPAEAVFERGNWLDEQPFENAASRLGVTPTAFGAGLYAWALGESLGLSRVALLTPVSHRVDHVTQRVVGCCNQMRPFVVEAGANEEAGIEASVRSASESLLDAYESPPIPFELVAKEIRRRGGAAAAVVPFGFAKETRPPFKPPIAGLSVTPIPIRGGIARFRVGLSLDRRAGGLIASLSAPRGPGTPQLLHALRETMKAGMTLLGGRPAARVMAETPRDADRSEGAGDAGTIRRIQEVTPADRAVAEQAWRDALGGPPAGDGAHFFNSGGHSLLLLRLSAVIRRETGIEIPLGSFLDEPTFQGLLQLMSQSRARPGVSSGGFEIEEFGDGDRVVVAIPGAFGRPLAFRQLADELAARNAGITLRSYNMFDAASDREVADGFDLVAATLAADFARPEVVGAIGYCAGGLYPLYLEALPESAFKRLHLWLVNVFAPDQPEDMKAIRSQSLRDAALDIRGWPGSCYAAFAAVTQMASVRIKGRLRGVDGDPAWHGEFNRLVRSRRPHAWRGQATVFIAGRKPPWRHYYKNARLNGMTGLLEGPTRPVIMPTLHQELLSKGAARIADELLADLGIPKGGTPA